jgi:molybdate transport system substrate-binding protein
MKRKTWQLTILMTVLVFALTTGCDKLGKKEAAKKPELLIYCGITMIKPMAEIAGVIEKEHNCKIHIIKDGSGNLLKSIKTNKIGDLYLPGSDSYIKTCLEEGLILESETVHVGYNKAAMMVQKGNPKNITADLDNLAKKEYYVAIANPKSGSIGREAKKILDNKGIFDKVIANARRLTTDSKDLTMVLKDKEADLVINWFATSTWPENIPYVDVLHIDEKYASKKKLVLGLLKTSSHPDIARAFMQYASSKKGRAIFNKYGLYDVR